MKYSSNNKPLECILTESRCYNRTTKMTVKGVLWHSTAANNTTIRRYVQPSKSDPNYDKLMELIGKNDYNNDWNDPNLRVCVHAFVGTLKDGTVTSVHTLPWDYKPYGCGAGSRGSCNDGWIQFEICEDNLNNKTYFDKVYKEACELTAYLCKLYNLDPKGTSKLNGYDIPVILCHGDANTLKVGSNHVDVLHWFKKYNKTMDDVRNDVAKLMGINNEPVAPQKPNIPTMPAPIKSALRRGAKGGAVKELQTALEKLGYSCGVIDGSFGNKTLSAVLKFQRDYKLAPDGCVGPITWCAIHKALKELHSHKNENIPPVSTNTPAQTFTPYTVKVTANLLNYRSGPGSNYSIKGQIKKDGVYTIIEEKDGWGKLKSGAGWVSLEYVQKI